MGSQGGEDQRSEGKGQSGGEATDYETGQEWERSNGLWEKPRWERIVQSSLTVVKQGTVGKAMYSRKVQHGGEAKDCRRGQYGREAKDSRTVR